MFKYSFDTLVYGDEPVRKSIERLAKFGYDAVELVGEAEKYSIPEVRSACADNGIVVSSLCSIFDAQRDMVHPDPKVRQNTLDYVQKTLEFGAEVGASVVIVRPSPCMKTAPLADAATEHAWAVENMRKSAEMAAKLNLKIVIECWNRYEAYMLNRLDQALALAKEVNMPNCGVMGDTFHMCLEELDLAAAFRSCGEMLYHVHLADSNRAAPGIAHLDFVPILKALKDINYQGYLSFEILPAAADPFAVLSSGGATEFLDPYTKFGIDHMKKCEKSI